MNILHVYKTYITHSTGGVEQTIQQICHVTTQQGIHNRIFCLTSHGGVNHLKTEDAEIMYCPTTFEVASTPFSWQAFSTFKKLTQWADIIHYHFPWPFADLLHCFIRPNKPSIVTYHSDIVRQKIALWFYRPLQHYFLKSVTHIVATSPPYRETSAVLQNFLSKSSVIPIGLDKPTYGAKDSARLDYWRKRVGQGFFLFVGVMRYYKGLNFLLEAAKGKPFQVLLAGAGAMESGLKAQAKSLQLTNVQFLGKISNEDKAALLMLCLGVVFPSHLRSEAFGVSLLEGAMYGKALLSTEIGTGTSYINVHQVTGLVVPPADPPALADAMQYLYANPLEAIRMGAAAKKRYLTYFTAKAMGESYMDLYHSIWQDVNGREKV